MLFWQIITLLSLAYSSVSGQTSLRVRLTCEQVKTFVDGHNLRRFQVAQGLVPRQPSAANMKYMVWDDELAEKAARWAENGFFGHNPDRTIWSQRWDLIGENVYINNTYSPVDIPVEPIIDNALDFWFNEHYNYGFEPYQLGTVLPIGHYTQMVWAETTRVGCGISQKKENGWTNTLFVCNYGPTGNFLGKVPYSAHPTTDIKGFLRCVKGECYRPYGYYC